LLEKEHRENPKIGLAKNLRSVEKRGLEKSPFRYLIHMNAKGRKRMREGALRQ